MSITRLDLEGLVQRVNDAQSLLDSSKRVLTLLQKDLNDLLRPMKGLAATPTPTPTHTTTSPTPTPISTNTPVVRIGTCPTSTDTLSDLGTEKRRSEHWPPPYIDSALHHLEDDTAAMRGAKVAKALLRKTASVLGHHKGFVIGSNKGHQVTLTRKGRGLPFKELLIQWSMRESAPHDVECQIKTVYGHKSTPVVYVLGTAQGEEYLFTREEAEGLRTRQDKERTLITRPAEVWEEYKWDNAIQRLIQSL